MLQNSTLMFQTLDDINSHIRSQELSRKRSQTTTRIAQPSALKSAIITGSSYKYSNQLIDASNPRTGVQGAPPYVRRNAQTIRIGNNSSVVTTFSSASNSDKSTQSFATIIDNR